MEQQHVKSRPTASRPAAFIIATAIAGFPLGAGLLLFAMNQEHVGRMIFPNSTQPYGWGMVFVFVACVSLAHFSIRRSFALFNENGWLGLAGVIGSLLLVFLALFILLLGPAILAIMNNFAGGNPP